MIAGLKPYPVFKNGPARDWYMHEAAEQNWSSRQLNRQISVLNEGSQIFAAKYVKVLPAERELTREIERERRPMAQIQNRR